MFYTCLFFQCHHHSEDKTRLRDYLSFLPMGPDAVTVVIHPHVLPMGPDADTVVIYTHVLPMGPDAETVVIHPDVLVK